MTILVTGAAGCLGLAICKRLVGNGHKVYGMDDGSRLRLFGQTEWFDPIALVNSTGAKAIQADFRYLYDGWIPPEDYEAIIHCAAQTSHPRSIETPEVDFKINALGTFCLLEYLRTERSGTRFVYLSTSKVYGERADGQYRWPEGVDEHCPLGDQSRMTPFGISKVCADLYTQEYGRLYKLRTIVLRPNCVTGGPGTRAVDQQNWLPRIVRAAKTGEALPVYGHAGEQVRDVLHADDLADAVALLLAKEEAEGWPHCGEVYNVGGGQANAISFNAAIDLVARFLGKQVDVEHLPSRYGDWFRYVTDHSKLTGRTGWRPKRSIASIVEDVCNG